MRLSQIAKRIVETHSALQIRFHHTNYDGTNHYVVKSLDDMYIPTEEEEDFYEYDKALPANKGGWSGIDMQTANVMYTVYQALQEAGKKKFDRISLARAVDFCWKCVK